MLRISMSSSNGLVIAWVRAVSKSPEAVNASMKPFQSSSAGGPRTGPDLRRRSSFNPTLCCLHLSVFGAPSLHRVTPLPLPRDPRSVPYSWPTYISGLARSLLYPPTSVPVREHSSLGPGPILSISTQSIGHGVSPGV